MTEQAEGQDGTAEIRRQFATLQAEMKRVLAEPPQADPAGEALPLPDTDAAADLERIERSLDDLRRDAERLRARIGDADAPTTAEAIAALRLRIDEIGRQAEDGIARLTRTAQGNRETVAALSLRVDALAGRRLSRLLVPLAILLGAFAIAGAILNSAPGSFDRLIDRAGPLVGAPQPHAALTEPPAPTPVPAVAALPAPPPQPAPALPAAAEPLPAPAAEPALTTAAAEPPAAPPPAPPVSAAPPPAAAAPPPPAQIVLHARSDAWVEVRNRQGVALISRLLRAGESWTVPNQPALMLNTGNAGGLELLVDGTPAPSLGAIGVVRHDVPLDPAQVRAGHYAADVSASAKPATASR